MARSAGRTLSDHWWPTSSGRRSSRAVSEASPPARPNRPCRSAINHVLPDVAILSLSLTGPEATLPAFALKDGYHGSIRSIRTSTRTNWAATPDLLSRQGGATVVHSLTATALHRTEPSPYREGAKAAAMRTQSLFADLGFMWPSGWIADDRAHPSDLGHRFIAECCLEVLVPNDVGITGPHRGGRPERARGTLYAGPPRKRHQRPRDPDRG